MKKILLLISAFGAFALILRFIEVPSPFPAQGQAKAVACTPDGASGFDPSCSALEKIKSDYLLSVKPIFEAKCNMCHGVVKTMPLYSVIPPSSWLVRHDVEEGHEHLNSTFDFPFGGHHSLKENLKDLKEVIEENEMPPLIYKVMHWKSGLTASEKKTVLGWIDAAYPTFKDMPDEED